jgi:hypothetical protein
MVNRIFRWRGLVPGLRFCNSLQTHSLRPMEDWWENRRITGPAPRCVRIKFALEPVITETGSTTNSEVKVESMSNYRRREGGKPEITVPGLRFVQFFTVLSGERPLGNLLGNRAAG